jgi:glucokinase
VPGPVEQPEGVLVRAPNIPKSEHVKLKSILSKELGLDVAVENDARCFALGEAMLGAGKGHKVVFGITIGTGVGGGLVVDGKIYGGAHGFAGEIGHMLLMPGEPPCETDDKRGTIEQFLSGTAFAERCKAAATPDDYLKGEACAFLHPEIFKEIAWLCTNVTHAYDPSVIVFGGSTGKALKPHIKAIEKELKRWLLPPVPSPLLAIAEREHPGALGAALLSRML